MPVYEYYCKQCGSKFELLRSMSRADEPARCPQGHERAERTLSVFASIGRGGDGERLPSSGGGGCACGGGGCGCGH